MNLFKGVFQFSLHHPSIKNFRRFRKLCLDMGVFTKKNEYCNAQFENKRSTMSRSKVIGFSKLYFVVNCSVPLWNIIIFLLL